MSLKGKTLFVTGASRGIGLAIALRCARDGANVTVAAKTTEPHPKLPGTIYTAAEEIEEAGGRALPLVVDVRDEEAVKGAIERTAEQFGGLDIVVNNASAISLTPTPQTDMKRFDLMHGINTRGTFLVSKYAIPHLARAENPHILMLSPPLDMQERWFKPHLAYSLAKYGMSLCVLGLAGELRAQGIAVNALWPRTTIATAAIRNILGGDELMRASRQPRDPGGRGLRDLPQAVPRIHGPLPDRRQLPFGRRGDGFRALPRRPSVPLAPDFFVPDDTPPPGVRVGPA
jgi:citronellol/citronellal dehydrogenase